MGAEMPTAGRPRAMTILRRRQVCLLPAAEHRRCVPLTSGATCEMLLPVRPTCTLLMRLLLLLLLPRLKWRKYLAKTRRESREKTSATSPFASLARVERGRQYGGAGRKGGGEIRSLLKRHMRFAFGPESGDRTSSRSLVCCVASSVLLLTPEIRLRLAPLCHLFAHCDYDSEIDTSLIITLKKSKEKCRRKPSLNEPFAGMKLN